MERVPICLIGPTGYVLSLKRAFHLITPEFGPQLKYRIYVCPATMARTTHAVHCDRDRLKPPVPLPPPAPSPIALVVAAAVASSPAPTLPPALYQSELNGNHCKSSIR